ncbi:MAG TPA: metallophosphoesterase [Verrucomicrobiae bacterium]|nr:metallophosphoesterase [Verrucomicrobiae bacterium]
MKRRAQFLFAAVLAFCGAFPAALHAQASNPGPAHSSPPVTKPWRFAVSGDSRNCGDVVMPAIAAAVRQSGASFYWHLGDFRKMSSADEDIQNQPAHLGKSLATPEYVSLAWQDFLANQIEPFGNLPVYLARGNHETVQPKTRADYLATFGKWLDTPGLRAQRLLDDPAALNPQPYYHWIAKGVDFITLDNAGQHQFDPEQVAWFEKTLQRDFANRKVRTMVVGMHEALPESISKGHSMNESEGGTESGRRVYADLLHAQNEHHKRIYVLASHSHYFMDGIFNTEYWRAHGGVLPGWIVGTAGAERYKLPPESESKGANAKQTDVYGFLLGAVDPLGRIQFDFHQLSEQDLRSAAGARYAPEFVDWCFAKNSQAH